MKGYVGAILLTLSVVVHPVLGWEQGDVIRVGYLENTVMVKNTESIDHKGYGYDYLMACSDYTDLSFEFVPVFMEDIEGAFARNEIDVFGGMTWNEQREQQYCFSEDFGVMQVMLVADSDSAILYDDFSAMLGEKVTALEGFEYIHLLEEYKEEYGLLLGIDLVATEKEYYSSDSLLHLATDFMEIQDKKVVAHLGVKELYFVAHDEGLIEAMDEAMAFLEAREPWIRYDIYSKYMQSTNMVKPVLTAEQMTLLKGHGEFTVGYGENLFPLQGKDSVGNAEGFLVDLMDLMAEKAGISLQYVPFVPGDAKSYAQMDLSIAYVGGEDYLSGFSLTDEIEGSPPLVLLARRGLSDPVNQMEQLGMLSYCTFDSHLIEDKYKKSYIFTYDNYEEMIADLHSGKIQGMILSSVSASYLLMELGETYYDTYYTGLYLPLRLFVSHNLPDEYINIFNILLAQLGSDEVDKLILDQVAKYYETPSLMDHVRTYWYLYVAVLSLGVLTVGSVALTLQRKKQEEFLNAVNYDTVTGLYSEVKFLSEVRQKLRQASPGQYRMITVDIDQFGLINRQYGNRCGDLILKKVGENLKNSFPNTTVICRSGDDLFYIFAPVMSELRALCGKAICNECLMNSATPVLMMQFPLSLSRGIYLVEDPNVEVETMIAGANMAKSLGKSTYGMTSFQYTKDLEQKRHLMDDILTTMEEALRERALRVQYQVKVELATGKIVGAEALVRWFHLDEHKNPVGVRYLPEDFISLFEENGFITKLDYYVFGEVCGFIARNRGNPNLPKISMNLSGLTLLRTDLECTMGQTLQQYGVEAREIDIELTESAFTHYPQESAGRVSSLRKLGYTVAMDDFGTGASSLNRLKDMDISALKLDKGFLDYNLKEGKGSIIVGNMIAMAKEIGVTVIAEGVETQEQLDALKQLGCEQVQGFYYCKAVGEEAFLDILRENPCLTEEKRHFLQSTNRYVENEAVKRGEAEETEKTSNILSLEEYAKK